MVGVALGGAILSLFTLGDGASWITLGVGSGIVRGCTMRSILSNRRSVEVYYVPILMYGAKVVVFFRAWLRSRAAWVGAYADDMRGIENLHGKIFTVLLIRVPLVLSI